MLKRKFDVGTRQEIIKKTKLDRAQTDSNENVECKTSVSKKNFVKRRPHRRCHKQKG